MINGLTTAKISDLNSMKVFAETNRLILREIIPEDAAGFFEMDSDPAVHKYLGNKPVINMGQVRDLIRQIRQQYIDNDIGRWAVIEKSTGNFTGWAGLKLMKEQRNNQVNYFDVGYRLIKKYWGKGYATEAALASLAYGFDKLKLEKIIGMADVENRGSRNVLEKAGLKFIEIFDYEGTAYSWYEINRQEWETGNLPA
jgi:ribosomal-protein-alanine N-acetyltransferase